MKQSIIKTSSEKKDEHVVFDYYQTESGNTFVVVNVKKDGKLRQFSSAKIKGLGDAKDLIEATVFGFEVLPEHFFSANSIVAMYKLRDMKLGQIKAKNVQNPNLEQILSGVNDYIALQISQKVASYLKSPAALATIKKI